MTQSSVLPAAQWRHGGMHGGFLAMEAAGYITGQVVGIDGGMLQEGFRYVLP